MVISVTQRDIDSAEHCSCSRCPLAQAIRRVTVEGTGIQVYPRHYYLNRIQYRATIRMIKFIAAFDDCKKVVPTIFEFHIPDWLIKEPKISL